MANPVGYSTLTDPLQGLTYGGTSVEGGAPNVVGGLSDPDTTGDSGRYWYLAPLGALPKGIEGVDWPRCSVTPHDPIDTILLGMQPYGAMQENDNLSLSYTSGQASAIAAGANCEYVSVVVSFGVGMFGGSPYCNEDVTDPPTLSSFTVTMGGAPVDVMPMAAGARLPDPCATYTPAEITSYTPGGPKIYGVLMRPTALTWPYQDPDNQFNRAIWGKDEIGAITWSADVYTWSYDIGGSYSVFGYKRYTDFPTPCPHHPAPPTKPPTVPSALSGGAQSTGHLKSGRMTGTSQQAPPPGGYTPTTWAQALLGSLGFNVSANAVADIVAWENQEGGHWNNAALYNPLNTTQTMPGSTNPGFSAGVQAYVSWAQGLQATVITLNNGNYPMILDALSSGADLDTFKAAVDSSPWGTVF